MACERRLSTELESAGVRQRWQWEEGLKWRWVNNLAYWPLCLPCHNYFWPYDYRAKNNSFPGGLQTKNNKRRLVSGDFYSVCHVATVVTAVVTAVATINFNVATVATK